MHVHGYGYVHRYGYVHGWTHNIKSIFKDHDYAKVKTGLKKTGTNRMPDRPGKLYHFVLQNKGLNN